MAIFLRQDLVSRQLAAFDGGLDGLVAAWAVNSEEDEDYVKPRQRSSIYRWLQKGIPARGEEVLAICGLLGVDPLALFDYPRNGFHDNFAKIRRSVQLGREALGVLSPIFQLYKPGPYWPSDALAKRYWSRPWFAEEFSNKEDWRASDYVLVKARFKEPVADRPRAVHIAYRRLGSRDTMWRYYGTVISIEGELQLYSESGDFQPMKAVDPDEIRFRTYFGGRPVEFKLASLHAFNMSLEFPFNDLSTIGFEW